MRVDTGKEFQKEVALMMRDLDLKEGIEFKEWKMNVKLEV